MQNTTPVQAPFEKINRCFIIGPMKDMSRLNRLSDEIIKPLLGAYNFKTTLPDDDGGNFGNIMRQVLLNLEQADLLIADISGHNPNVMYEMGIYHCFGKPCITVRDASYQDKEAPVTVPFDIAAFRFVEIDLNNVEYSKQQLKKRIDDLIANMDKLDWFNNPVTDFYHSPVAEIPTAIGLSKNYKKNFLSMLFPHLFQKNEEGTNYKISVSIETGKDNNGSAVFTELTSEQRKKLTCKIYIPAEMHMSKHDYIFDLKDEGKISMMIAEVGRKSRPFKMFYYRDDEGNIVLVDIPTVLSTLNESIEQRRVKHADQISKEDWVILERQELERFANKCRLFVTDLEKNFPTCRGKINIEEGWNPQPA